MEAGRPPHPEGMIEMADAAAGTKNGEVQAPIQFSATVEYSKETKGGMGVYEGDTSRTILYMPARDFAKMGEAGKEEGAVWQLTLTRVA
jgi:hypothetical protein